VGNWPNYWYYKEKESELRLKEWRVQLDQCRVSYDSDLASLGIHCHPTPETLVGSSIVYIGIRTPPTKTNPTLITSGEFENSKPAKIRKWQSFEDIPIYQLKEILKAFDYEVDGSKQDLVLKLKELEKDNVITAV